ncbi:Uncharacterized protein GBIM_14273 [Gryllus bimaculatus]|nr:Uncharacterized protein GBIM_14273 [Gryllus bimaculatus]
MLSSFTSRKTPSSLIIIEDNADQPSSYLFQTFIHNASLQQLKVHVICFENPVEKWTRILNSNVNIHDCFSDHRGWNNVNEENDLQGVYQEKGLLGVVQELLNHGDGKPSVVCIDSLTPVLFRHGLNKCYRDLHALLSIARKDEEKLNQLVAVIHEDAVPERWDTLEQMRHLATTVFQIQLASSPNSSGWGLLRVTHRKAGGKIVKQKKNQQLEASEEVDPTVAVQNLTTFKLTLNPQEEEARSQLILPYTRQGRPKGQSGGGKVFYEPDAADDWDDEDPDDDLDV